MSLHSGAKHWHGFILIAIKRMEQREAKSIFLFCDRSDQRGFFVVFFRFSNFLKLFFSSSKRKTYSKKCGSEVRLRIEAPVLERSQWDKHSWIYRHILTLMSCFMLSFYILFFSVLLNLRGDFYIQNIRQHFVGRNLMIGGTSKIAMSQIERIDRFSESF